MLFRKILSRVLALLLAAGGATLVIVNEEVQTFVCEKLGTCAAADPSTEKTP